MAVLSYCPHGGGGMGMSIREALKRSNKTLMRKIDNAMTREVFASVRDEEAETIVDEVYFKYTPLLYHRRGQYEGLGDPDNIVIKGGSAKNGKMAVVNVTTPNSGGCSDNSRVTMGKNLPELIEYGNGYKFYHYDFPGEGDYMKPRPFTAKTISNLKISRSHVHALRDGLRRQGINVK